MNQTEKISVAPAPPQSRVWRTLWRRYQEIRLIGRDPILAIGLLLVGIFVLLFIAYPLLRVVWQGFFELDTGQVSFKYFARYFDPVYRAYNWGVLRDTMMMGLATAAGGTLLGFIFAYTMVRCNMPGARYWHVLTLLPTISPPFAIAIATILLFGRSGLVTRQILGIRFIQGMNDIYGIDGLVFVQIITFFPVAYLIIRAMLERLDPSIEEAALSLGASKFHIFRTVTLPLLIPGMAGSFLLLFVESLADLGNPLLLGGNRTVLSVEIFLSINGLFDQQRGAALSLVLLLPTLTVFLLQHYYVSRRSYVAVTGKPTGGANFVKEPLIRWSFIVATVLVLILVLSLYLSIVVGSLTTLWGINNTLNLTHYGDALTRGMNAILSTTFLSAVATPIAGIIGMVIAFLVVRKVFAGKQALDFISNLGGAVPGTILGIGYIIAFVQAPLAVVIIVFVLLAFYLAQSGIKETRGRFLLLVGGTMLALGFNWLFDQLGLHEDGWRFIIMGGFLLLAAVAWRATPPGQRRVVVGALLVMAALLLIYNLSPLVTRPLAVWGRSLGGGFLSKLITKSSSMITVFTRPTMAMLGYTYLVAGIFIVRRAAETIRPWLTFGILSLAAALTFWGEPLALIGTPYIVIAAYAVRSLPASVRAGVAALQQIDPAIEEASNSLGADAQYTFRHITLPLILPAFIAGLIFAFARHMTSLSAIIFLTTAEWPILTVWILSEVEQGGMSTAAAYSVILILIVLVAIGLTYWWLGRTYGAADKIDISLTEI
ncbi:MAG: iron ABC transporter permease [Ardenticatenaceae bacterium]|nr:iron ABC transporter permease [Ardenticatenaceae bacterium]